MFCLFTYSKGGSKGGSVMKSYAQSYEPALTPPVRKHFYTQLVTYFINTLGDREGSKVAKFKNKGDL